MYKSLLSKSMLFLGILFLGSILTILIDRQFFVNRDCKSNLELINKDIRCSNDYVIEKHEYLSTRLDITEYLEKEKSEGRLTRFSIYFRDLDNGPTFGINEKEDFVPASLLKLPLMVAYLRSVDEGKDLFSDKLRFDWAVPPSGEQYHFEPKKVAKTGLVYSVEELIDYMIKYSDNNSYLILLQHLETSYPNFSYLLDTFKDIGIIDPENVYEETIYTKSYASIFRALYNASYLSRESSEKALEILSQVDFKEGLNGGVPENIKIAHKFGERGNLPDNQKELHDCGIVYFPGNPYLICVMVEGYEFTDLSSAIKTVSKMVYEEVDSRKI